MALFGSKTEEKKADKEEKGEKSAVAANVSFALKKLILQPRVSEKAGLLLKDNKYVFLVKKTAGKVEIKKAVESIYKVKVTQVNVINNAGKSVNFGRIHGKRSAFKKAIVTLKQGDSIKGLTDVA